MSIILLKLFQYFERLTLLVSHNSKHFLTFIWFSKLFNIILPSNTLSYKIEREPR